MSNNFRPVYEQPIYKIIIEVRNLSLDKAIPQFAAAIDTQIDCDDASDDFIKKKLHSNIRRSSTDSMTQPYSVRTAGRLPTRSGRPCLRRVPYCESNSRRDRTPVAQPKPHQHRDVAPASRRRARNPRSGSAI